MSDEIGKGIWDIANKQMKTESIAKESFFTDVFKDNPEIVEKANKLINELEKKRGVGMSEEEQTEKLANFIMKEFPDKITNGGAGDVAIEILSEYKKLLQTTENTKFKTDGNLVYSLIQDGWENGKPRMVNDIYFSIYNKKQNKKEQEEIAKRIAVLLNEV